MFRAVLSEIFAADCFITALPVFAADPAALIAEELHLIFQRLRQGIQLAERFVQPEIRHHIEELLPGQFLGELSELRQDFCGG